MLIRLRRAGLSQSRGSKLVSDSLKQYIDVIGRTKRMEKAQRYTRDSIDRRNTSSCDFGETRRFIND
jgi:hypothetical protein